VPFSYIYLDFTSYIEFILHMSEDRKGDISFWERIQETFKVVILNEETFQEVRSFKLSRLRVYAFLGTLFLLLSAIILSIFFFTPARKLVPGFGEIEENSEFIQLKSEMDTLESIVANQQIYISSLRTLLSGESDSKLPNLQSVVASSQANNIELSGAQVAETTRSLKLDQLSFVPPVRGTISAKYAPENDHQGIDIIAAKNTPIQATMQGIVVSSDWTMETGNTIIVQHPNDILSAYKHNSALLKKIGDRVEAGEAIAIIGNSGELTDGPHLHFELWYEGFHVDPSLYIRF